MSHDRSLNITSTQFRRNNFQVCIPVCLTQHLTDDWWPDAETDRFEILNFIWWFSWWLMIHCREHSYSGQCWWLCSCQSSVLKQSWLGCWSNYMWVCCSRQHCPHKMFDSTRSHSPNNTQFDSSFYLQQWLPLTVTRFHAYQKLYCDTD